MTYDAQAASLRCRSVIERTIVRIIFETTFTKAYWFTRLGRFEAQLELNPCPAHEGWLSVTPSGIAGVMIINIGRGALHLENTNKSAKHFAAMRSNAGTVG